MKNYLEGFSHAWEAESLRYFSLPERPDVGSVLPEEVSIFLTEANLDTVLDVGCGNGSFLSEVLEQLSIPSGVGVEPSRQTVEKLSARWAERPDLKFEPAAAERLPFEDSSFDFVIAWSVLHWIGREHYLQALGELVRVTNNYLLVMDFCPSENYRTPYKHREGWFTYKADFDVPLIGTGVLERVLDLRWVQKTNGGYEQIFFDDLKPFLGNPQNWFARRCVLYKKDLELEAVYLPGDFHH